MPPSDPSRASAPPPRVGSFRYLAADDTWEWSEAVFGMHGYTPGEITPTTQLILQHKHPDDRTAVTELIDQARRRQAPFSSRHRIIDTHGDTHLVVVVGDRLQDEDNEQVIGTTGFYVDITETFDAEVQGTITEVVAEIEKTRAVINQAMGLIMGAYGVPADQAFEILTWRSQQTNVKLRVIAEQFVADVVSQSLLTPRVRSEIDHLLLTAHKRVKEH